MYRSKVNIFGNSVCKFFINDIELEHLATFAVLLHCAYWLSVVMFSPCTVPNCQSWARLLDNCVGTEAHIVVVCIGAENSPFLDPKWLLLALTRTKVSFIIVGHLDLIKKQQLLVSTSWTTYFWWGLLDIACCYFYKVSSTWFTLDTAIF